MARTSDETLKREVGERLSLTRQVLCLTQREVSEKTGIHPNAYSMVELGERPLHPEDALRLRELFGVTLDWLYAGDVAGLRHELAVKLENLQAARKIAAEALAGATAVHQDRRKRRRFG